MPDLSTFRLLGEALAIGLLVGAERYKDREPGEKKSAGIRTFAIFSLLGAVCSLIDQTSLTWVTFAALASLLVVGYYRDREDGLGLTTEAAGLLVFWIGYLLRSYEVPAISLGIVLTIFLASKRALHDFVKERISELEWYATLKFLAVVLVVYPILPDQEYGPLGFFNPREIWGLVILVSTISYGGYFLMRWLGQDRGLKLSGLVGGIVSTTAVTMSLANTAKHHPESSRVCGTVSVMANTVQPLRVLALIWVVYAELGQFLGPPLVGMAAAGLCGAAYLSRRLRDDAAVEIPLKNPYSLAPALKFGMFFVSVLFVITAATHSFGQRGAVLASAIAGLGSVSAPALSISALASATELDLTAAGAAILVAIATNGLTKLMIARFHGTSQMAFWLGAGLLLILATGVGLFIASVALEW